MIRGDYNVFQHIFNLKPVIIMIGEHETECPACGESYAYTADMSGRKGRCPACGGVHVIPPVPVAVKESVANPAVQKFKDQRRRRKRISGILGVTVLLLAVAGIGWYASRPDDARNLLEQVAPATEPDHDDRELVRKHLAENTPTGKWEEIRWWRAVDQQYEWWNGQVTHYHLIRVKYRTANERGGMSVHSEVYNINDGEVDTDKDYYTVFGSVFEKQEEE